MKHLLLLCLLAWSFSATAQEANPIIGVWKRSDAESTAPGQPPQMEVREYRAGPDGHLVGLAVWVSATGRPGFLQFTAKSDGEFYPEHDSETLSDLQANGTPTPLAYAEKAIDANTVEWTDQFNGAVTVSGTKVFSDGGRKMTIVVNGQNRDGTAYSYELVYIKQN
jgi:hypothetical protein